MRFLLLVSTLSILAPLASADVQGNADVRALKQFGCDNYGNQIKVGSTGVCESDDCDNYGNQVFVGSSYDCEGGDCHNFGIQVRVGSSYCGDTDNEVCVSGTCTSDLVGVKSSSTLGDCVPKLTPGTDPGAIHITCDDSGSPCGVNQQPVCWTVRLLCMMDGGLDFVLRLHENVLARVLHDHPRNDPSSCEGQPGWSDFASFTI